MLNSRGEKMRLCLCNIFKVVLKFHNRIRMQNWNESKSVGPNYENLERMYVAFCEQRAYLAHVAEKLTNTGYQPHLMQFLHALNINHRYDLISQK
jgi:gamma-tubulin complex component 6